MIFKNQIPKSRFLEWREFLTHFLTHFFADDASDHPGQVQGREGEVDAGEEGFGDDAPAEVPVAA